MTNQEIFNMLSEVESQLFYAYTQNKTEGLRVASTAAAQALEAFAMATGCHN